MVNRSYAFFLIFLLLCPLLNSSAQIPSLDSNPQISVDCERIDDAEYISFSSGIGYIDCSITNEESKDLKIKFSFTGNFEIYAYAYDSSNEYDIENGDEILLKSDSYLESRFLLSVEKMEPTEEEFNLEIIVTESQEFNGWEECQDCEPHEFKTTYKIAPWAEIASVRLIESNIQGFPVGMTDNDESEIECNEDLLSETSINVEFEVDASSGGRDSMYLDLWFQLHLFRYTSDGVPIDGDLKEVTNSMKVDFDGTTTINATLNLDAFENRSGNEWYIALWISGNIYLDQYQNMERDSIIESKGIWFDRCELNSSIIDPDLELLENELQIENVPSVNTFFLILTILCAVMRRNNFVN